MDDHWACLKCGCLNADYEKFCHACEPPTAIESFGRAVEEASASERVQFSGTRGHHAVAIDAEGRIQPWRSVGTWNPISLNDRCVFCGGDHARGIDCPSFDAFRSSPYATDMSKAFTDAATELTRQCAEDQERRLCQQHPDLVAKAYSGPMVTALAKSWGRTDDLAKAEAQRHVDAAAEWLRTELRRLDPWLSGGVTSGDASGLFVQRAKGAENA